MVMVLLLELVELSNEQYGQLKKCVSIQFIVLKHLKALYKIDAMAVRVHYISDIHIAWH
jgi:hypothetical protein